jgi:multiple sugar transport system ATP-binding protein
MAHLSLRKISKTYAGGVEAVKELDLEIADRDFIVLVGPSGCGKSTTLRMIAGLEEISSGELLMDGVRINERLPKDRDMAMVFQNYALYPHMSVYDNIAFGLKVRKTPKVEIKTRVEEAAHMLEIGELLRRKPRAISGGERQRVAFARAIVRKPRVFLLDEPLSNLDAALRDQIRMELIALHQRLEATFVYVTHDQTEAMTLGTRIVIMKDGLVQQVDAPANIYNKPQNVFVAGFIGSPKMNLLPAQVESDGNTAALRFGGQMLRLPEDKSASLLKGGYGNGNITMGIRPEHIELLPNPDTEGEQSFEAEKEIVELRGADSLLHLRCGENLLTARLESAAAKEIGQRCYINIFPDKLHLFDAASGRRID